MSGFTPVGSDLDRYGLSGGAIAGELVFAAAMALDADALERVPEAGSIADETKLCVADLERTLTEAGCGLKDLVKVNCYLSEDEFRTEFWATYDELFADLPHHVRITHVAGIAAGCRVELDAVAVRPAA